MKTLFFDPPSRWSTYLSTNVSVGAPSYPSLTLATLAGHPALKQNSRIVDLDLTKDARGVLFKEITAFKPDVIASTANTPDYLIVRDIMRSVKKEFPGISTIVGGVHITALPGEAGREDCFDYLVLGEGDRVLPEISTCTSPADVAGIAYKEKPSGERKYSPKRGLIRDLDELSYPAWHLFALNKYKNSRLSARRNPVGLIETSRGCAFQCNFCNKLTFGSEYRMKSSKRVVDEMEYMLRCGFKEIHIIDDSFTQDLLRAKDVCIEIKRRSVRFPWSILSGVRVDRVDAEFFRLAKEAGCWQVGFGIESGNQDILDRIQKKTTLPQIEKAVRLAGKAGISTFGFFILGLSQETEEDMKRTIEFASKLPLDIAKFDICIPYPGTPYYKELTGEGRIRSKDWSRYLCHNIDMPLFDHPHLSWPVLREYYKKAFRRFYLRPGYIMRRFFRSLRRGDLVYDCCYFLKSKW
jgi:anaerobic magnesium-protoporphyrin IX monomethyl ester cyclase